MCAKQFESFLVEQFLLHAKGNIRAGYRYQFNSPDHANSQRLFDALLARKGGESEARNGVALSYLDLEDCKVVPVLHSEDACETGFTENYISNLRDEIASQDRCGVQRKSNSLLVALLSNLTNLETFRFAFWTTNLTRFWKMVRPCSVSSLYTRQLRMACCVSAS